MTISSELTALQQDITNARTAVINKGGTVTTSGGSSQLATDIATIPQGVSDVATSQEMDANLIVTNAGKMYHYTGTTTANYVNGRYYLVKNYDTRIDFSKVGANYVFENSDVLTLDQNKYFGAYRSKNYNVRSSYSIAKIYTKSPSLTVWINSYAESGSDYTIASIVDSATYPISAYESNAKANTSGFQKDPRNGLNTTYWKKVEYTTADGLTEDDTEHYIWIVYRKDSSVDINDDRGYLVVEKPLFYQEYVYPSGNLTITDTSSKDVTTYKTAQVVDAYLAPSNIKKDVTILGVTGSLDPGGGSSGYTLEFKYSGNINSASGELVLNNISTKPLGYGNIGGSNYVKVNMPNISTFTVKGDSSYRGDCRIEYTVGGTTSSLSFGQTVTMTADASLYFYEAACLTGDTTILMADGSYKVIKDIKIGDKVLSYNPQTMQIEEDEVTYCDSQEKKFHTEYDLWEFENDYKIRTVHRHRFYNVERQAMVYMDEWEIGNHTITKDGEQVALLKHTNLQCETRHFTLFTKNQNYFANGLLSGNRETQEFHFGTDEQKNIQSNPSEINESESINGWYTEN